MTVRAFAVPDSRSAGAVIPDVSLWLYKEKKKNALTTKSNAEGNYTFPAVAEGTYILEVSVRGFKKYVVKNIEVKSRFISEVNVILEEAGESITVGIFDEEPMIDTRSSSVQTTLGTRKISLIPHK